MARPWQSHEEWLTDMALQSATSSPDDIRQIRPAFAQNLFTDTRGVSKQEASIYDIMDVNRYGANNRTKLSGFPVRRTMVDDQWSGAGRYSMEPLG